MDAYRAEQMRHAIASYDLLCYVGTSDRDREVVECAIEWRDGDRCCWYCGANPRDAGCGTLSLEHVTPARRGGSDHVDNLVFACARCNLAKRTSPGWVFVLRMATWGLLGEQRLDSRVSGLAGGRAGW